MQANGAGHPSQDVAPKAAEDAAHEVAEVFMIRADGSDASAQVVHVDDVKEVTVCKAHTQDQDDFDGILHDTILPAGTEFWPWFMSTR